MVSLLQIQRRVASGNGSTGKRGLAGIGFRHDATCCSWFASNGFCVQRRGWNEHANREFGGNDGKHWWQGERRERS